MSAGSWEDSSKIKDEKDEQEPVKKRPPPRPAGPPPRPSAPPPRPAPISIKPSSSRSTSPTPHPPPPASLSGAAVVGHTLTTANKKAHKIFSSLKTKAGLKSPKHFIKDKKNKSPLPSPSKEKFDSVAPEEKTNGSEEWFAFQRMLERTKETVIKTKENLSRLTSKDEPDYSPDSETESKGPPLKRKDALDSLDEETEGSKQGKDIPQLTVTSVPSRPSSQDFASADKDPSFELDTDSSLANGIDKISSAATGGSVQDLLGLGLDDFASPPEPESDDWLSSHKSQFEKDFLLAEEEKLSRSTKSVTDELVDSFLGLDTIIHRSPLVSPTVLSPVVSISASEVSLDPFVIPKIPDPVDLSTIRKGIASGVKSEPDSDPFFVKSATSSPPDPFLGKSSDPFAVTPVEPSTDPFAVSSDPFAFKSKPATESNAFILTADSSLDPFAVTPTKPDTNSLPFLTPDLISTDPFAASTSDPFTPVKSGLTTPTTDPFALTSSGFASPTADLFPLSPGIPRTSADLFGPANEIASSSTDPFSNTLGQPTSTSGSFVAGLSAPASDPFAISSPGAELFASATSDLFESKSGFATPSTDFFAASPAAEFPAFPATTSDQFTSSTSTDLFGAASDLTTKLFPTSISTDPTTSDPFAFAAAPAAVIATPEPYSTISEPLDFTSSVSAGNPFLSAIEAEEDADESVASGFEYFSTISEPLETFSAFDFETEASGPLIPEKDPFSTTSEPIDVASDNFKKSEELPAVSQTRSIIVPKVCITNSFETVSEPVDSNVDTGDIVLTPSSPVEPISSITEQVPAPVVQDSTSDPFRSQSPFGFSDTGSFPPPPPPTEFTDATFDAAWSTLTPTDITLPPAVDTSTADSTFSLTNTAFTESANIFTSANMSEPTSEPLFPVVPEAALLMDPNPVAESSSTQETKPAAVSEPDNATVLPPAVETIPILEPDPATKVTPELTDTLPQTETVPPADAPASDPANIFGITDPIIPMAPLAPMIPLAPTPVPVSSSVTAAGVSTATTDSTSAITDFSSLDTAFSAQDDFFSGTNVATTKGSDFFSSETIPATTNTGGDMFSLLDDSFPAAPTTAPAASDGSLQDTVDLFGTSDTASKTDSSFPAFADSSFAMTNSAFSTLEPSVISTPTIFAEPTFSAMDPVGSLTTDPTDSVSAMEMSQNNPFEGMDSDDVPVPISGNNPFSMFETIEDETSKEILDGPSGQTVPSIGTESVTTNLDAFLQPSVVPQPVTTTDNVATTEDTTTITTTATDTENVPFTDSGANPFMDKTEIPADPVPASATEATEDFFDEDFFNTKTAEKKAQGAKINPKSAWGMMESVDKDSTFNPFQDDNFDADNIPKNVLKDMDTQNQEVPTEAKNPFLSSDFEAPVATTTETTVNPFLTQVDELEKAQSTLSDNLSLFLSKGQELDPSHLPLDVFDPFKTIEPDDIPEPTVTAPVIQTVDSSDDEKDSPDNEDNKDAFKLTIRMRDPVESGPSVALPPPPKVPKSPQMAPRINPFDKESPPEENFAKFEVMETKEKPKTQRTETQMSVSTDGSGTPDEEEENLEPLESFLPPFEDDGWSLMLRQPTKKKLTGNRYWKTIFLRLVQQNDGPVLKLYHSKEDKDSFQELPLQPCYSMSDIALQHYDQYGKIHTLKIQYVFYRERVGIRTEKITPTFVKNMKPKANMILDHSPQISELLKFGSLDEELVLSFVQEVEDALMRIVAHREKTLSYQKDEVIVDVIDEYKANIDTTGHIVSQKGRVRIFCLSFVTGMPFVELGVNDRRRKGREVVGRHDIIPIKTEEWIKPENIEFHCSAKPEEYEKDGTIKFHPLDACHFELMRFRVRLRYNKELPLQVRVMRDIKERHVEYRCDVVCTGYHAYSKKHGQFPCEDIEIRFPIPDCWIYLFRYEKRFGYGSFKSATRKPGKIKGLERLTMMTQSGTSPALLEASVGTAKYENIYHAIVWRISRLPERNQGAYKTHLFTLRLDLGLHDEIPETYEMFSDVKFTMPASTISKCQIRSISCGNPTPPEKWVRYIAHYQYKVAIDHKFESSQVKKAADIDKMVEAEGETSTTTTAEEEASGPGTSPES